MYDLAVAYRIYPKVSEPSRSLPFDDDKYRQADICLRSFKRAIGDLKIKLWAIMDGCPNEYEQMFRRYFADEDLVIIRTDNVGNQRTFSKQVEILLQQTDSENVYFAEDDYLYLSQNLCLLLEFFRNGKNVHFVSAFDHPDDYDFEFHNFPKWLQVYKGVHWRNTASTCLTFLTSKSTLAHYRKTFLSYEKNNYDTSLWVSITKYRLFNFVAPVHYRTSRDSLWGRILIKSWLHGYWQNLFGTRARLWVPMPSIALHLDRHHVAPGFDLAALMLKEAESGSALSNPHFADLGVKF